MSAPLLVQGNARHLPLQDASVHTVCTSPPYFGLRSYNCGPGELGLEDSPEAYVAAMVQVFREVKRVLHPTGLLFINIGDAYREKQLLGLPWRLALGLQADGWILRAEVIWSKRNCMPESVQDRFVRAHEQVFMFAKQTRYFFDMEGVREPYARLPYAGLDNGTIRKGDRNDHGHTCGMSNPNGRACRSVWSLSSEPTPYAHFATFPQALVRRCLLAGVPSAVCARCSAPHRRVVERTTEVAASHNGSRFDVGKSAHHGHVQHGVRYVTRAGDMQPTCSCNAGTSQAVILDPFCGSGTTLFVARELGHHAIGIDLSAIYLRDIARTRLGLTALHAWEHGAEAQPVDYTALPLFAKDTP